MSIEKPEVIEDEVVVKQLCVANGLSYEMMPREGGAVASLEVFFSGYPCMFGTSLFPNLLKFTIVNQNISHIQGLECCPLLQELWVVECQLTAIDGLQTCLQLEKLYLYDNHISKIENLERLTNLQVLWLNNNNIHCIEGLNTLHKLREVNLADNKIEKIGHSLHSNLHIEELNLSGNKIASFKELAFLAPLLHLKDLALQDSMSVANPVCRLYNYSTHVLYHMPGLRRMDSYDVSSGDEKDFAKTTVMKKMMYYRTRMHGTQKVLREEQCRLTERKETLWKRPAERIRACSHAMKDLELALSDVQDPERRTSPPRDEEESLADPGSPSLVELQIHTKMEALAQQVEQCEQSLEEIQAWYKLKLSQAAKRNDGIIDFLLVELQAVGNIRFEDGCPTDPWFTSCQDLVLTRFCAEDLKEHGVTGLQITSIVRTHNRALRLRFEEKLNKLLADEESTSFSHENYQCGLDYAFYVPDIETSSEGNEMLHILEEGFPSAEQYKALGREGAVLLSSSLTLADAPRLQLALRQDPQSLGPQPFTQGRVVVSKVFLGRNVPVRDGVPVDISSYPNAHSVYRNVPIKPELRPRRGAPSHWFVFDHELVLPEYIVHYEYVTQGATASPDLTATEPPAWMEAPPLLEILQMDPALKPFPRMVVLNEATLLAAASGGVLSQITMLNLHGNSLSGLKELSRLRSLRHLTVSFNALTRLDDISHMPNLEFVDASYNRIASLDGWKGLRRLRQLDVRWNQLTSAREEVAVLRKQAPVLFRLDTRHNPWNRPESVRITIVGRLGTLTHLDDVPVTVEEVAAAAQIAAASRINQGSLLRNARTDSERPRSLNLLTVAQLLCQLSPSPWTPRATPEPGWTSRGISRLRNLDKLINLRWASFNDNDISKVEGLENCLALEELSLNHNRITNMDGLYNLHRLVRLSLKGNQLHSLDPAAFERLPYLLSLSVEDNRITSMHGLKRARVLLELYIGNNHIATTRDVYHLKALSRLVILDLHGNPLVDTLENYRINVVFLLPALIVLDGVTVDAIEAKNAKNVFAGRLSPDMVAEKLGHEKYSDVRELDMQACSISMVDLTPTDLFLNLRIVNLEKNDLTSFSGLVFLPQIKELCLNHNHIESILPPAKSKARLTNRQLLLRKVKSSGYGRPCLCKGGRAGAAASLEPLMGSLEVLHLSHNGVSNMASLQLSRLTNLKALFLQGNEISQVEGLEGLTQLRELVLDGNRIQALGEHSLVGQSDLLELHLAKNRIRDLSHLEQLLQLRRLFLTKNKIQDVSELEKLEALSTLVELSVIDNPVARRSLHRPAVVQSLSSLQVLDGLTVSLEERTQAELCCTDPMCLAVAPPVPGETGVPGWLQPLTTTLLSLSLAGGTQTVRGHDVLLGYLGHARETLYNKKRRPTGAARISHAETSYRPARRTESSLPAAGLLPERRRLLITNPCLEGDSRIQNSGSINRDPVRDSMENDDGS